MRLVIYSRMLGFRDTFLLVHVFLFFGSSAVLITLTHPRFKIVVWLVTSMLMCMGMILQIAYTMLVSELPSMAWFISLCMLMASGYIVIDLLNSMSGVRMIPGNILNESAYEDHCSKVMQMCVFHAQLVMIDYYLDYLKCSLHFEGLIPLFWVIWVSRDYDMFRKVLRIAYS